MLPRRALTLVVTGLALGASIASPTPPFEEQWPRWSASAYYSSSGFSPIAAGETTTLHLTATVIVPSSGGSGGWTSRLVAYPYFDETYPGLVTGTLADADGALLAEAEFPVPAIDPQAPRELRVDDPFPECEAGATCEVQLTLTLTAEEAEALYSLEIQLSARDNELSDEDVSAHATLTVEPG